MIMTLAAVGAFAIAAPAGADYEDPLAGLFSGPQKDAAARPTVRGKAIASGKIPRWRPRGRTSRANGT